MTSLRSFCTNICPCLHLFPSKPCFYRHSSSHDRLSFCLLDESLRFSAFIASINNRLGAGGRRKSPRPGSCAFPGTRTLQAVELMRALVIPSYPWAAMEISEPHSLHRTVVWRTHPLHKLNFPWLWRLARGVHILTSKGRPFS